jgi:hypothetical protein
VRLLFLLFIRITEVFVDSLLKMTAVDQFEASKKTKGKKKGKYVDNTE